VAPIAAYDPLVWVDPFIATGGEGAEIANVNPGASVPFGMTHVGPDSRIAGGAPPFYHCAGYWWNDTHIHGFSHTHAHGMGVPDFGGVSFFPTDGASAAFATRTGRMATFSHDEESASPGRYAVTLGTGINVQTTATTRGGHTKITWPAGADPVLWLDLDAGVPDVALRDATITVSEDGTLTGYQRLDGSYSGRFGGVKTWVHGTTVPAAVSSGVTRADGSLVEGEATASGEGARLFLRFPEGTTAVDLKIALSTTSADGAAANFAAELSANAFEDHVAEAEEAWRTLLSRVRVRGGTEEQRFIFHTAMFHAAIMPRRYDDVDGTYRGLDDALHVAPEGFLSDLSLWDTFRTHQSWLILAWPEVATQVASSLARMTVDGGSVPRWPLAHGYTGGMVGTPATQVIAETWRKGLTDFPIDDVYAGLVAASDGTAERDARDGAARYVDEGFMAVEDGGGSVSETLEYTWSDHALAGLAEARGEDAARFHARSEGWKNLWYEEEGFFTGRCADATTRACSEDGVADAFAWPSSRSPETVWASHFVEGNAWHYLWYVPWDVQSMVDVQHGGDHDAFHARLASYWTEVYDEPNDLISDTFYWHGNEPVLHNAFLGSLDGRPDLTADPVRWILANRYAHDPVGLDGNDDAGTLSAWYLLAATGFYPVAGTLQWAVASPIFERVEIDRPGEAPWVVRAPGTSDTVRYVTSVRVDGVEVGPGVIDDATLHAGEVDVSLSASP
jgi:predicted alpha-1,2-mannosidase